MATTDTEKIVRELVDKEAIRDLACRYAHCVWRKDVAGAVALFAEDGEMDTGDRPPVRGREALLDEYRKMITGPDLMPFVHDHLIELHGDTAEGSAHLDLRGTMDGVSMVGAGWYEDHYVRTAAGWRFQRRKLTMSFFVPLRDGWGQED